MAHINCRSLNKKFTSLQLFLNSFSTSLTAVAVSETWFTPLCQDSFNITGYNFLVRNRISKTSGGVGIYLNSALVYKIRDDLSMTKDCIECQFVEVIQKSSSNILIRCVYRPPGSNVSDFNL